VREVCLWLPEAEEFVSHGSPNFRVRGKTFATYVVNHHGDQRVALWLPAPAGAQDHHLRADPRNFYVPPYVGVRGWIGVRLDHGLAWKRVIALVREAYEHVAPASLKARIGAMPVVKGPTRKLSASEVDPFKSRRAQAVLKRLRKICLELPETSEGAQFGHPVFKAGERTFAIVRFEGGRLTACFWVGAHRQGFLTVDERFGIPPYFGHNGWIALDVSVHEDVAELAALALESYRHFALKRMLRHL
jgi:predicted DNA-binding protein (MmcQ/YjbR family)